MQEKKIIIDGKIVGLIVTLLIFCAFTQWVLVGTQKLYNQNHLLKKELKSEQTANHFLFKELKNESHHE